ncbi:hypothetical protein C5O00_13145 [Pukyongia salina]|uniref:Uncharacterized protein n=2 Tax=Pukyongia salina TaxID=2094025 RepID=A0A2S0HZE1_9FLAO|nr:hypothetical protein C5O00_13145 [Pukyongia salina]
MLKYLLLILLCIFSLNQKGAANTKDINEIDNCLSDLNYEIQKITNSYSKKLLILEEKLKLIRLSMNKQNKKETYVQSFIGHIILRDSISQLLFLRTAEIDKVRYSKGIEIIKILYEKSLALDHHFTTVNTLNDMHKISNPNNFKEFAIAKQQFEYGMNKRQGFNLGNILGENMYASIIHSMISLFSNSDIRKSDKTNMLQEIECVMDFTLQMYNDLNTVYFESVYLKKGNKDLILDLEQLFTDYTNPIKYKTSLNECRDSDDWLTINLHLDNFINRLKFLRSSELSQLEVSNMQIDLDFSIDRLLHFIGTYNSFINDSRKFYEKFAIMLDSYENEDLCNEKIPQDFITLKKSINLTIEKFDHTYRPVEITGSKMKQLLYGVGEY